MKLQNFEIKNGKITNAFLELKRNHPEKFNRRLNLSWSNWGFGIEELSASAQRLYENDISYIELHGNHYGADLGYKLKETKRVLDDHGLKVSGICGMFSPNNDLSSNCAHQRQSAIDYLKREIEFTAEIEGNYILVVPGAVGRPEAYDDSEFERSVESLRLVTNFFAKHGVKGAIEPVRSDETSLIHTISEAKEYIYAVNHSSVNYINADVYHMQTEEAHIGEALLEGGEMITNLHLADSNRNALGSGSIDLDTIIKALYLIGYNEEGKYVTPEPLGPGGNPYPAMYGKTDKALLDKMVSYTTDYFREREEVILNL